MLSRTNKNYEKGLADWRNSYVSGVLFQVFYEAVREDACDKLMQVNHTFRLTVKVHTDVEAFEFMY